MEQLNWEDTVLALNTSPDVPLEEMPDFISMKGAFDILIPRGKPLPKELYSMTSDIEEKLTHLEEIPKSDPKHHQKAAKIVRYVRSRLIP